MWFWVQEIGGLRLWGYIYIYIHKVDTQTERRGMYVVYARIFRGSKRFGKRESCSSPEEIAA